MKMRYNGQRDLQLSHIAAETVLTGLLRTHWELVSQRSPDSWIWGGDQGTGN